MFSSILHDAFYSYCSCMVVDMKRPTNNVIYSKKECCKQYRHVKFKGTMTKSPVQKEIHRTAQTHAEPQDALILIKLLYCTVQAFKTFVLKHAQHKIHIGDVTLPRKSHLKENKSREQCPD